MMTFGENVYGWFGITILGFWFTRTVWGQYKELTVSARRMSQKILSSCTIAAACFVVGGYLWLQHQVPILGLVHQLAAAGIMIPSRLYSAYIYVSHLPTAVWIVLTWSLTISTKRWSKTLNELPTRILYR